MSLCHAMCLYLYLWNLPHKMYPYLTQVRNIYIQETHSSFPCGLISYLTHFFLSFSFFPFPTSTHLFCLTKVEQIVSVFHAASKQKAWDHFSKAQRKNLDLWRTQVEVGTLMFKDVLALQQQECTVCSF